MILPILTSALLFYFSFPNFMTLQGFSCLAWIFAVPLFFCLEDRKFLPRLVIGLLFGLASNLAAVNWMIPYSLPGYLLLSLSLASQAVIFALLYRPFKNRPVLNTFYIASAWVTSEYLRKILMFGESWNLAHSQAFNAPLMQISGVFGSSAVSFILIALNYGIYTVLRKPKEWKIHVRALLVAVALLAVVYGYGLMRLAVCVVPVKPVNVCVLQTNHDYHGDLTNERIHAILDENIALTKEAVKAAKADLIVWPETAIPTDFLQDPALYEKIAGLIKETGTNLLIGAALHGLTDSPGSPNGQYNSAVLFDSTGEVLQIYHKRHLIPLTEFIPDTVFWKTFAKIFHVESPELAEGRADQSGMMTMTLDDQRKVSFAVAICSEDNVDALFHGYARQGAQFVVVILNNGWFTQKAGFVMHAQHSMVRAFENRLPVIRSANGGWSVFIDELGGTKEETLSLLGQKRFFHYRLASPREKSPYNNLGDTFCFLCVGFVILMKIYTTIKAKT